MKHRWMVMSHLFIRINKSKVASVVRQASINFTLN